MIGNQESSVDELKGDSRKDLLLPRSLLAVWTRCEARRAKGVPNRHLGKVIGNVEVDRSHAEVESVEVACDVARSANVVQKDALAQGVRTEIGKEGSGVDAARRRAEARPEARRLAPGPAKLARSRSEERETYMSGSYSNSRRCLPPSAQKYLRRCATVLV